MKRLLYSKLLEWKNKPSRKPLILEGARQVGKTWLLKEFGNNEYDNVAYINCDNNELMNSSFDDFDISRIIMNFSLISKTNIEPGNTLIILDEIQEVPLALTSLKYFCEDAPDYHIAVAGSFIGIKNRNEDSSGTGFPVGKVDRLKLYPLSFTEFLLALGEETLVSYIEQHKWEELNTLKSRLINYLKQYYYVGGMPTAVNEFVTTKNLYNVRSIQKSIISEYEHDFNTHAFYVTIPKLFKVWNSIPSQLNKGNKKFFYNAIKPGARAKEFEDAIEWLQKAGLIYKVRHINKIEMPLKFYEDSNAFKIFIIDLGLLGAMYNTPAENILIGPDIFSAYNGSYTEQYIAQQLVTIFGDKVYYYTNDKSSLEINFVVQWDTVYPIDVHGKENLKSKALQTVLSNNTSLCGLRFSASDYRKEERMNNVPLPLAEEYIKNLNKTDLSLTDI